MKVGIVAPLFSHDARRAVDIAVSAEDLGIDGVFVYDHLYPLGEPQRYSLSWLPVLSAIGEATNNVQVSPLVARIGVSPTRLMQQQAETLSSLFGHRFVYGIGVGDAKSKPEYVDYGVEYKDFPERLGETKQLCLDLAASDIKTWVSAHSPKIQAELADVVHGFNLWDGTAEQITDLKNRFDAHEISWAGTTTAESMKPTFDTMQAAGADWMICGFRSDVEDGVETLAKLAAAQGR